jgi:hypothetical protein
MGIVIADEFDLAFKKEGVQLYTGQAKVPEAAVPLAYYSERLVQWLPIGFQRMLWIQTWRIYPPGRLPFMNTVRHGCGELRDIWDAPGHIFETTAYKDYETRTPRDVEEEAIMTGMVLLSMCFDWEVYLLAQGSNDYIYISDGYVRFSSVDQGKLKNAPGLIGT